MIKEKTKITSNSRRKLWAKREANNLCIYCGKQPPHENKKGCIPCLNNKVKTTVKFTRNNKEYTKQYNLLVKHDVIDKYGGQCNCCGEKQICFLTIDHINNDGAKDRLNEYGVKNPPSRNWYLKLRREEKRDDLQILCFNCNLGKHINGGICPHIILNKVILPQNDKREISVFDRRTKFTWPTDDELIKICNESCVSEVARKLNVHDTAIRGRLQRRNKYHLVIKKIGNNLKGETNPSSKLTEKQVKQIRKKHKNNYTRKELAAEYNVSKSTIDLIVNNKIWKKNE